MRGPLHNPVSPSRNTFRPTGCPCDMAGCRSAAASRSRGGFTLVEMLITITIIGILAAGVTAAVQSAREAAKASATKATITKLHYIIMARYDSYRTRRVPIDAKQYVDDHPVYYAGWTNLQGAYAHARLMALRDLMRLEMPDRWSDVFCSGTNTDGKPKGAQLVFAGNEPQLNDQPSISLRYRRLYLKAVTDAGVDPIKLGNVADNAAAECLYMIVMSIPEAAEQFQATEISDVDGDGLKEFIDAWGHPIRFIRWPVGFVQFDKLAALQPSGSMPFSGQTGPAGNAGDGGSIPPGPQLRWDISDDPQSAPSDLQSGNRQDQPDPFDSMGVGGGFAVYADTTPGVLNTGPGYAVFPLIYSAGPDGIYDINIGFQGGNVPYEYTLTTIDLGTFYYTSLGYYQPDLNNGADDDGYSLRYIGQPLDGDAIDGTPKNDELNHYDNIHNHRLEVR